MTRSSKQFFDMAVDLGKRGALWALSTACYIVAINGAAMIGTKDDCHQLRMARRKFVGELFPSRPKA